MTRAKLWPNEIIIFLSKTNMKFSKLDEKLINHLWNGSKSSTFQIIIPTHRYSTSHAGIISCIHPANERGRYNVTWSLIGRKHSQNYPCPCKSFKHTVHTSLCLVVAWHWPNFTHILQDYSHALGQSKVYPSAIEVTLKGVDKYISQIYLKLI